MLNLSLLLLAATIVTNGAVIAPAKFSRAFESQPTCACTQTVTSYMPMELQARQESCPPPTATVTERITVAPILATIVANDPSSVSSWFSRASAIDSASLLHQSQDQPVSQPAETTPHLYTYTASAPEYIGSNNPTDGVTSYVAVSTTSEAVATTTLSFPPNGNAANGNQAAQNVTHVVTSTTYLSTTTIFAGHSMTAPPSNLSISARDLQQTRTCSLIFAPIGGQWASWCNSWDGSRVVTQTSFDTTVLITNPPGASPIPQSVWSSSMTGGSEQPTSTSTPASLPGPPMEISTVITTPSVTIIPLTVTVVATVPVTTITQPASVSGSSASGATASSSAPAASSSCGQVGDFTITFDELPAYSTHNPNDTASPPIFSPYDHFYWTTGYGYGPPPDTPYQAYDGGRLAMYDPADAKEPTTAAAEGIQLPGSFGAGRRAFNDIYWFNAKSAHVGCNNTGSQAPCTFTFTGYQWTVEPSANATVTSGQEKPACSRDYASPALCADPPCMLTQISFDEEVFSGLSSINIKAMVGTEEVGFFLDSFEAAWTNNTCEAGIERQSSRKK